MQESAAVSDGDHKLASHQPINDTKATESMRSLKEREKALGLRGLSSWYVATDVALPLRAEWLRLDSQAQG